MVAHVMAVEEYGTSVRYDLEDGTSGGQIRARHFHSHVMSDIRENVYVQIEGTIHRGPTDKKNSLTVKSIHKVTDVAHHVFFHLLEVAFVTMYHKSKLPVGPLWLDSI